MELPIPLSVRSQHSLGFGVATVEALAARAAALGLPALALSDVETLAGQPRFHDACADHGLRPITGVELRYGHGRHDVGRRAGRVVLLAVSGAGFASLCRVVSARRLGPQPAGDPVDALAAGVDDVFVLVEDVDTARRVREGGGVDGDAVRRLVGPSPAGPAAGAGEAVADVEVLALAPEDRRLHALARAVRSRKHVGEVELDPAAVRPFDRERLLAAAVDPAAVLATHELAEACRLDLRQGDRVPPLPADVPAAGVAEELRRRAEAGLADLRDLGRCAGSQYDDRLRVELRTLEAVGVSAYVWAASEVVRGARHLGIATSGRGSAAGSLVAFTLGITPVDPVAHDLLFERFVHGRREAPPDIDLDVASHDRARLVRWVIRRFGRERVAGVATYVTFGARSAVREGLRALGLDPATVEATAAGVDATADGVALQRALTQHAHGAVRANAGAVARLVGLPAHVSAHPGGHVIADRPLAGLVPLDRAGGGAIVTQYDLRSVERSGLLKLDLLGNHFLTERQETLAALPRETRIPEDDAATWQTLDRADTVGLFAVESPAVRAALHALPIRGFADLVSALAVVRPGAAAGASKARFIRRARGEEGGDPTAWLAPDGPPRGVDPDRWRDLRRRLGRSHGVVLFDEDIIRLLATVGSQSLAEADRLRADIVSAGDEPGRLLELGRVFVAAAVAHGTPEDVADRAWRAALRFAAYSFAEAHAASHAALAWQAAWLRTHAPAAFACSLLEHHRGIYPLRTTVAAIGRWGVTVHGPHLERSELVARVEPDGAVRAGLGAVKGLRRRTAEGVLALRPFTDLADALERVRPSRTERDALVRSGACDGLVPLTSEDYPFAHEALLEALDAGAHLASAIGAATSEAEAARVRWPAPERERYARLVRVRNEVVHLGMHPSDHPVRLLRDEADRLGCVPSAALAALVGQAVAMVGIVDASQEHASERGTVRFVTFEDEHGLFEALLPEDVARSRHGALPTPGPYLLQGVVRSSYGQPRLGVRSLTPFHERALAAGGSAGS